jgi:hypothetical protein
MVIRSGSKLGTAMTSTEIRNDYDTRDGKSYLRISMIEVPDITIIPQIGVPFLADNKSLERVAFRCY